jgi:hypothetical protein
MPSFPALSVGCSIDHEGDCHGRRSLRQDPSCTAAGWDRYVNLISTASTRPKTTPVRIPDLDKSDSPVRFPELVRVPHEGGERCTPSWAPGRRQQWHDAPFPRVVQLGTHPQAVRAAADSDSRPLQFWARSLLIGRSLELQHLASCEPCHRLRRTWDDPHPLTREMHPVGPLVTLCAVNARYERLWMCRDRCCLRSSSSG